MSKMGVPKDKIIQEKTPYIAKNLLSKFGDDAITTADKAPQPAKTTQEEIMDFNARNPNPNSSRPKIGHCLTNLHMYRAIMIS